VGKGEEVILAKSSCQQGVLTDGEEEEEERPHAYEGSCGTENHVNEDDDKLETFITKGKDQRSVLVIGGVEIFLPSSQGEVSTYVAGAIEGQKGETFMKEREKILKSIPIEEEHPVELLTQWEMELKALEDCLDSPEPEGGCHEIAMCWQPIHIFHCLISCLHQCFTNINFPSQFSNERRFLFFVPFRTPIFVLFPRL
jgi:hypothetical protein